MSHTEVIQATPAARESVVETVVSAFAADPAFRYFFPDEATFIDQAAAFAGYLFDQRVHRGTVWVVENGAAVAMWDGPRTSDGNAANGHEQITLDLPKPSLERLDRYGAVVYAALPPRPHWYLGVLATHPGYAGRGWGRLAMTAGLDLAAAAGLPAYLETTKERNIELYRKAGWHVTESTVVDGLQIWVMRHG
ncbi:MAG TPA: GNAT family N-acetyltransferase [Jiangellaceae bacterium]|nr:GNAT family N-acetyltransferase [Jiangellaceae bacterium]